MVLPKIDWGICMKKKDPYEVIFLSFLYLSIILFTLAVVYPFYQCVVLSFNDGRDAMSGGIYFWPRKLSFYNYTYVFSDKNIANAAIISVLRTVIGVVSALLVTSIFSYAISKKKLLFRKTYITLGLITMYFGGGLIPSYLLIRSLNLFDNFLVYILPNLFGMYNAVIFITFFSQIPQSLEESAKIDGANDLYIFFKIIFPISTPVFATIALFVGVGHWNSWFDTMLYTKSTNLNTLSHLLTKMINSQQFRELTSKSRTTAISSLASSMTSTSLMLATMVVTTVPIIVLYPFLQKHFVKGIMLGSLKG